MTIGRFALLFELSLLLQAHPLNGQGRWLEVTLPAQDTTSFRISFVDSVHGWIAARSGVILATSDGGCTWRRDSVLLAFPIFEFKFVSPNVGWILASNPGPPPPGLERRLYKSMDAGFTWIEKPLPDSLNVTAIAFTSETLVRVAGGQQLWATTDGAQSWELRSAFPPPVRAPASLDFYDDLSGYAGGGWLVPSPAIGFLETSDGGLSWIDRWWWGPEGNIVFRLLDHRMGMFWLEYFVEEMPREQLQVTSNRGASSQIFVNIPFSSEGFYIGWAPDSSSVWLLRRNGRIHRKAYSGSPWQEDTLAVPISELLFDTYGHRFALGKGRLFRFDTTSTDVADNQELPLQFALFQNYPNPFNPATQITFALPSAGDVRLVVYDVLGREVAQLVHGQHEAGYHTVTWGASNCASGVYFVRLTVTDELGSVKFTQTRKVLLLR